MKALARWFLPVAIVFTLPGCPVDICGCTPPPSTAVVYGTVTSPASEAVFGATVIAYSVAAEGCHANYYEWLEYAGVPTELDGSYRKSLDGLVTRDSICVFVFARPPDGSTSLATSDTSLVSLDFRGAPPEDSARVDLVLRAR